MRVRGTNVVSSGSVDRSNEGRMDSGTFVGFPTKSSECILIATGEAISARTIPRRPVSERRANPEEIVNVPVWPWDRPGHQEEAAVRPMGQRRERNLERDEAPIPKAPAEAAPSMRVSLKQSDVEAQGLRQLCLGCRAVREGHTSARTLISVPRANGRTASRNSERANNDCRRLNAAHGTRLVNGAAKRIKLQFADRPVNPSSSSSELQQCKFQRRHCRE